MKTDKFRALHAIVIVLCLTFAAADAFALKSRRGSRARQPAMSSAAMSRSPWLSKYEMGGYFGWLLAGEFEYLGRDIIVENVPTYGGYFAATLMPGSQVEFWYGRADSSLLIKRRGEAAEKFTNLAINYFQLGGIYEPAPYQRFKPFISGSLGGTYFVPDETSLSSEFLFSFQFGLGFKLMLHPRVGIRGQARLLLPVYFDGGGFICGSGGCSGYVSTGVPFAQGDFTGGVFLAF